MLETAIRQVRVAIAMVTGRPLSVRLVRRLVDDALATLAEFGSPGDDVAQLVDGPFADPAERLDLQTGALRRTARRLAARSAFYRDRFATAGIDPAGLTPATMPDIPVTEKNDLVRRPADFLCGRPQVITQTTGTTGAPVRIWLSRYEVELWPALIALSMLLRGEVLPGDCMHIGISSRATAAVQEDIDMLRLAGAACRVVGQIPPDEALDHLLDPGPGQPTLLNGYPSYVGQLVTAARRRGLGPGDFRLRSVYTGGEILSPALAEAVRTTLGAGRVDDTYGMTEVLPVGGRSCSRRHLHLDVNMGFTEVIDLAGAGPAGPGALGTLVITPYFPYRECMPVFRYDTRDVVRVLPAPPDCELAAVPAVSAILGKADGLLRTAARPVTPREVVEVLDDLPGVRWPVRYQASVRDGRLHVIMAGDAAPGDLVKRFAAVGIEATAEVVPDAVELRRLRCDLRETTFVARPS
ncbi:MAG TPA: hypothetical protein VFV67_36430 [Actinophytocola sp.]|uniref:phenylacetate--CoA ligase family protein n=1 Tax=Actinophytocola sp. TaxID=1872138 RepID=UPI002DB6091D|nr:hypothetical protein [Actinophytocola sp.]HEU5476144.1 hypothetical protein [Actinophytocola sp.]